MAKVKLNLDTIYTCAGVRLMPGVNVVDDKALAAMQNVKAYRHRVEQGIVEELTAKRITAKDVAEMYDRDELERLSNEGTKAVKEAAAARLDELFPKPEGDE